MTPSSPDWQFEPARDLGLPPLERLRSTAREPGLASASLRLVWWTAWAGVLRCWNRLSVSGQEHLPKHGSFIVVANHESHLDVFAIAASLPLHCRRRFIPISADDVFFDRPATTLFAAHVLNALPLRRGSGVRHGLAVMRERLQREPTIFALFPAGRRSRDASFLEFKAGIGVLVAGTEIPVVPCHLEGCFEALRPETKFIRPARVTVRFGAARLFRDQPEERNGWNEVAAILERDVRALGGDVPFDEPTIGESGSGTAP